MEIIDLEMIPGGPKKTCHASQFDNGRVIRFNLKENGQPFALSGTETVQAIIRKPDGSEKTLDITNTGSTYVDLITAEDTCDLAGVNHCEIKVTEDGEDLGSGNFDMKVEEDAYGAGDVSVGEASGAIASFETDIKDTLVECVCEINPVQDLHGEDKPYPAGGGVNIWDEEWELGEINTSGALVPDSSHLASTNYIRVAPNTNYRLVGIRAQVAEYDAQKTFIGIINNQYIGSNGGNVEFTTSATTRFLRFNGASSYGTTYNNDVSINYPSTDHDYHPYENICPILGFTEMDIIRSGVNLWDEEWESGTINYTTGENQSDANAIRSKNYIQVVPNMKIYFKANWGNSIRVRLYKSDKTYLGAMSVNSNSVVTINNANCYYIRFSSPNGQTVTTYNNDVSLNYPSTDTTYHPAEIIEKNIQLGQTVYGGVLDVTRGKLHVTWVDADLGNVNWSYALWGATNVFTHSYSDAKSNGNTTLGNILSDIYTNVTPNDMYSNGTNNTICLNNKNIRIVNSSYTDSATFKTAMSGKKLAYELATPFDIDLTPEQIETLVGQKNNVYHNANGDTAVKFYIRA